MARKPSLWRQIWPEFAAVAGLCVVLAVLASCVSLIPKPIGLPYPPGYVAPQTPGLSKSPMLANVPRTPIQRTLLASPAPNVTLLADFGSGPRDGEFLYESSGNGMLTLLQAYGATNVFPVWLDTNRPHLLAITSFVNWPVPGILTCILDTNTMLTYCVTNLYYESAPAYFFYCPTNCQSIALFQTMNGLQLVGWGAAGVVYQIQSSTDLTSWSNNATVMGTNGPYQVRVDGSQPQTFWRTSSP